MTVVALAICFCFAAFGAKSKQIARAIVAIVCATGAFALYYTIGSYWPFVFGVIGLGALAVVPLAGGYLVTDFARKQVPSWVLTVALALGIALLFGAIKAFFDRLSFSAVNDDIIHWGMVVAAYGFAFTAAPLAFFAASDATKRGSTVAWSALLLLGLMPIVGFVAGTGLLMLYGNGVSP